MRPRPDSGPMAWVRFVLPALRLHVAVARPVAMLLAAGADGPEDVDAPATSRLEGPTWNQQAGDSWATPELTKERERLGEDLLV